MTMITNQSGLREFPMGPALQGHKEVSEIILAFFYCLAGEPKLEHGKLWLKN